MDEPRWERIQTIFYDAVARPECELAAFLEQSCAGDASLLNDVRNMLEGDRGHSSLLDRGLPDVAYLILDAPVESFPFEEVGPYRLKRILGQGGMGVVCLAEREDTGAPVAIKFLRHAGISAPRREVFAREIKTLARLRHPYIARLYDAGSLAEGTPWFVMEYVEGARLTSYCHENSLTIDQRLLLFRMLCEAVQYAYREGIIHGDLKPSNILVERDGSPRLLDFGISRPLQNAGDAGPDSGPRFGSPEYAAPEWMRDALAGAYTDVYSLGVILFEMLAARLPGPGEKPSVACAEKASWSDLDALCLKAKHPDYRERYQSVEELLRDVQHYLSCEPLEARPGGVINKAGKLARRHRPAVVSGVLVSVLVFSLITFYTIRLQRARNQALAEVARTKTIKRFMLDLFDSGSPEAAPSNELRAITLIDRGAREAKSLNSDPETQAELYESLGSIYNMLAKFPESDRMLSQALDRMKAAVGPDHLNVADLLIKIAILRGDRSQFPEALRLARQGLAMAQRHSAPAGPVVIEGKSALGRITAQSGSYDKAIAILEPLLNLKPADEQAAFDLADNLAVVGICYYELGRHSLAEQYDRRALELHRKLAGNEHPRTATDLLDIGEVRGALGHYAESEKFEREAVDIMQRHYGADHPDTATFMGILSRTLLFEGNSAEAEGLLKRVLQVQQRNYGNQNVRLSVTLDSLGKIALERGELAAAQSDFARAVEIAHNLLGDQHYITATLEGDLGDVHVRQGKYSLADRELSQAVAVLTKSLPPGDRHIATAQLSWGRCLLRRHRYVEAETQLSAGYQILAAQAHPPAGRLQEARQDLTAARAALGRPVAHRTSDPTRPPRASTFH